MSRWNPKARESERSRLRRTMRPPVDRTSVNYPYTLFGVGYCRIEFGPAQLAKA